MIRRVARTLLVVILALEAGLFVRLWQGLAEDPTHRDFGRFYQATAAARAGGSLYAPTPATARRPGDGEYLDVNPPHFHLLVLPFTALSGLAALVAWQLLSVLALAGSLHLAARTVGWQRWPPRLWVAFLAVLLVFPGVLANFWLGQAGWFVVWLVTCVWAASRAGRGTVAGVHLGLAIALKPFLAPLLVHLAWRRQWRGLAAAAAACAVTIAGGIAAFGPAAYAEWAAVIRRIDWEVVPFNASAYGFLARAFRPAHRMTFEPGVDAPGLAWAGWIIVAALVLAASAWAARRREGPGDAAFAALVVAGILASPLGWVYYLAALVGPMLALFARPGTPLPRGVARGIGLAAATGLMWPPVALWIGHPHPWATLTFASLYFWGTLGLWAWLHRVAEEA